MRHAHHASIESPTPTEWTEERVEWLKKLVAEDKSASVIAQIMGDGLTRNAIIGKCTRLKLKLSGQRPSVEHARREKRAVRKAAVAKAPRVPAVPKPSQLPKPKTNATAALTSYRMAPPEIAIARAVDYLTSPARRDAFNPELAPPGARLVRLHELEKRECVWPLFEDGPQIFCGCPVKPQPDPRAKPFVYCEFHMQAAYPGHRGRQ